MLTCILPPGNPFKDTLNYYWYGKLFLQLNNVYPNIFGSSHTSLPQNLNRIFKGTVTEHVVICLPGFFF